MNISTTFRTTIKLFAVCLFISCDKGMDYNQVIENSSDHNLIVYIYPDTSSGIPHYYTDDSVSVPNHSEISIASYKSLGVKEDFQDCNIYADSIIAKVLDNDSLKVNLNLADKSNYQFNELRKYSYKHGAITECRLKITNDNIY